MKSIGLVGQGDLLSARAIFVIVILLCTLKVYAAYPPPRPQIDSLTGLPVYHVVEVDVPPKYNNQPWNQALGIDFNQYFVCPDWEDREFHITLEFVVTQEGEIRGIRVWRKKGENYSVFEKAVIKALYQCNKWSPGLINETPINVLLLLNMVW